MLKTASKVNVDFFFEIRKKFLRVENFTLETVQNGLLFISDTVIDSDHFFQVIDRCCSIFTPASLCAFTRTCRLEILTRLFLSAEPVFKF